jgi:hypothetical protein
MSELINGFGCVNQRLERSERWSWQPNTPLAAEQFEAPVATGVMRPECGL